VPKCQLKIIQSSAARNTDDMYGTNYKQEIQSNLGRGRVAYKLHCATPQMALLWGDMDSQILCVYHSIGPSNPPPLLASRSSPPFFQNSRSTDRQTDRQKDNGTGPVTTLYVRRGLIYDLSLHNVHNEQFNRSVNLFNQLCRTYI